MSTTYRHERPVTINQTDRQSRTYGHPAGELATCNSISVARHGDLIVGQYRRARRYGASRHEARQCIWMALFVAHINNGGTFNSYRGEQVAA
jgi:hypothetical protein